MQYIFYLIHCFNIVCFHKRNKCSGVIWCLHCREYYEENVNPSSWRFLSPSWYGSTGSSLASSSSIWNSRTGGDWTGSIRWQPLRAGIVPHCSPEGNLLGHNLLAGHLALIKWGESGTSKKGKTEIGSTNRKALPCHHGKTLRKVLSPGKQQVLC